MLLLQCTHTDHKPRHAIVLVDGENFLSQPHRLVHVAIGQRRDERAVEKLGVLRIGAQRGPIEGRGRPCIAIDAGVTGGKVAAGDGQAGQITRRWEV